MNNGIKRLAEGRHSVAINSRPGQAAETGNIEYQAGTLSRFVVVGTLSTGAYFVCALCLRQYIKLSVTMAGAVAFALVVVFNYCLHYHWTFRSTRAHASSIPRFIGTSAGGLMINSCALAIGSRATRLPTIELLLVANILIAAWNYLVSRFWVFVDERPGK